MSDSYVSFVNVKKSYNQQHLVVKDFNLDIRKGEFVTLLGPSGSGKSTCLMMLAGFEEVSSGSILIDGESVTDIAPYHRNIGMVFQHYALFPHMTIAENLAYPLKVRKLPRATVKAKVKESLDLVELSEFAKRYPSQLSGGQKQRVALARALIFEARIILMDEPLGALDKNLREQMQFEIKRLHEDIGFTAIYVTHDQREALTMSDRIAVFDDGIVQQCSTPEALYENPENAFIADFIGENNLIPGVVVESLSDGLARVSLAEGNGEATAVNTHGPNAKEACVLSVRPENFFFLERNDARPNSLTAEFVMRLYVGDSIHYFFHLPCNTEIMVKVLNDHEAPIIQKGEKVTLSWAINKGTVLNRP